MTKSLLLGCRSSTGTKRSLVLSVAQFLVSLTVISSSAEARLTSLNITSRGLVADGYAFGKTGPYEKLRGTAFFEINPKDPHNAVVFDIDKAPVTTDGLVAFSADFYILKPADLKKGNGALYFDAPNRGSKALLQFMNDSQPGNDPTRLEDFGNGFLMEQGYTLAWVGWQANVLPGSDRLTANFPFAVEDGDPITELIITEFSYAKGASTSSVFTRPLSDFNTDRSYESVSTDQAVAEAELRERPSDSPSPPSPEIPEGIVIPRSEWSFSSCPDGPPGVANTTNICLHATEGFRNDRVYALVYRATKSDIMGLGHVAGRDFISFLHHAENNEGNPIAGLNRVLCYGGSQSAHYFKDFIYQGFNEDEQGLRVCDGMNLHDVGAQKMPLHYRFAERGWTSFQHQGRVRGDANFPRGYGLRADPLDPNNIDGILKRSDTDPKIINPRSSTEYWNFRASLVDTDEDGTVDLSQPENLRSYLLSSLQHFNIKGASPGRGIGNRQCQQFSNPVHHGTLLRALTVALDEWVKDGTAPPDTRVPRIDDGTLVPPDQDSTTFPRIPGVTYNGVYNASGELYLGPGVQGNRGIIEPEYLTPRPRSLHRVLVPKVDAIGNDIAGIRHPFVEAPVATLTGWNLNAPEFTEGDLCQTNGMMIPLPRTRVDAQNTGDPRPSLEDLYGDHAGYVQAVANASLRLWQQRLMLMQDVIETIQEADESSVLR